MTTSIQLPPRDVADPLAMASRKVVSWAAADMTLTPRTAQTVAWSRDAAQTVTDSLGNSYDVVPHQLALHFIGEIPTVLLGANDLHGLVYARRPSQMSGLVEFYHRSGIGTGDGIAYIGNNGASGARLYISWSGSQYLVTHNNGVDSAVSSTMSGTAPTNGQRVRLHWELFADGSVRLHQSIGSAAETSAAVSAAHTIAAAWGDDAGVTHFRLNSLGTANQGEAAYVNLSVLPLSGMTLAQLEAGY